MTETLWIVGGEQRVSFRGQPEWSHFKAAVVARVRDGRVERVLEYSSPPERCPDEQPSHVFKAATLDGGKAWLCTQTEVLECDFPSFSIRRVISLPCFNDLHHVVPGPDGTLFVAVTGLDAVAEVSPDGELIRLVNVLGEDPWARFSPTVDYRKVPTTKPHRSHPNYVFFLEGRPWVTRFEQRDAVPLDGFSKNGYKPFHIGLQGIHDGHVHGNRLHFTTVDGHLVTFDLLTGEKTDFDLNQAEAVEPDNDRPLGWCRGLLPLGDRAWVGFTRLRYTKLRQNLSWIRHGFRTAPQYRRQPSRVALYDLEKRIKLREVEVEEAGVNAVFSIHAG